VKPNQSHRGTETQRQRNEILSVPLCLGGCVPLLQICALPPEFSSNDSAVNALVFHSPESP